MWNIWVYSSLFVVILLFYIIKKCTFAALKYLILLAWGVMFRAVIT